ncbi:MAG: hypothetical protein ABEK12_03295 [Candidatus Nanohaloarchaea archaeon]
MIGVRDAVGKAQDWVEETYGDTSYGDVLAVPEDPGQAFARKYENLTETYDDVVSPMEGVLIGVNETMSDGADTAATYLEQAGVAATVASALDAYDRGGLTGAAREVAEPYLDTGKQKDIPEEFAALVDQQGDDGGGGSDSFLAKLVGDVGDDVVGSYVADALG